MVHPAIPAAFSAGAPEIQTANTRRARVVFGALVALTKPRLAAMSVLTTVVGYLAARPPLRIAEAGWLVAGTSLAAAGALALNQCFERHTDARMRRTRARPLPARELTPGMALAWSVVLALGGVGALAVRVNPLAAALGAGTVGLYAFVYTPLKRRTRWATEIGAIAGALPPLIGWAAAESESGISLLGWLLFAMLFFWQLPHFFAIGWICRNEYRAAGFSLLPALDLTGRRTAATSLGYALGLSGVSLLPWILGFTSAAFGVVALGGGVAMLVRAWRFRCAGGDRTWEARRLFVASIVYLSAVWVALVLDRWL